MSTFTATAESQVAITVSWNLSDLSGTILGVSIGQTAPNGSTTSQNFGPEDSVGSAQFSGLAPGTNYFYQLETSWENEFGDQSNESLSCYGATEPTTPPAPLPPGVWLAYVAAASPNNLMVSDLVEGSRGYYLEAELVAEGSDLRVRPGNPPEWKTPVPLQKPSSGQAPALAAFNNKLVMAYTAAGSGQLLITSSSDGVTWAPAINVTGQSSSTAPALAVLGTSLLVLAYVATDGTNDLRATTSADGLNWSTFNAVSGQASSAAPALAVLGDQLVLAYKANDGANQLVTATSADGINWLGGYFVAGQSSGNAPALAQLNGVLCMAYTANNGSNDLLITTSTDGVNWTPSSEVPNQSSAAAPALAVLPSYGILQLVFLANNGSHNMLTTFSDDGFTWYKTSEIPSQASETAPVLCSTTL
jgi:hypothetical protein